MLIQGSSRCKILTYANENNYILQKLSLDEDKKKIWSKNRFYSYLDLIHKEKFRKLIKKNKKRIINFIC